MTDFASLAPHLYVAIAAGGVLAGVLNRIAAVGAVVPFLVLTSLGMPPTIANATNLAATPASFLSVGVEAWRERRDYRRYWPLFLFAIIGTAAGVGLFVITPAARFQALAPLLLSIAAIMLLVHPILKRRIARRGAAEQARPVLMAVGIFATSAYAGFFGLGVGVMVLLVLAVATAWPWVQSNKLKNVICLWTSVVGLLAYAFTGLVHWPVAALLGVSMFAGGLLGGKILTSLSREEAEGFLRETVEFAAGLGVGVMITT